MSIYNSCNYTVTDIIAFKQKMLNWASQFNIFCLLQNNTTDSLLTEYNTVLGLLFNENKKPFTALHETNQFSKNHWYFGHLGYSLQEVTENIKSDKEDKIGFADIYFFEADMIITINQAQQIVFHIKKEYDLPDVYFTTINNFSLSIHSTTCKANLQPTVSKEEYIKTIGKIKNHLQLGDCYEMNYCISFNDEAADIEPVFIYKQLCELSPTPFAALYRIQERYLVCASPERYLKKEQNRLLSQPIKGTIQRNKEDKEKDLQNKEQLKNSQKEISENVMIVDLVRNDLSKICKAGTVKVSELLQLYTFSQLHHLISSVEGELKEDISFEEIIKASFPMGSMTGAPKHKVLQLIQQYETVARGIFSGSMGYIKPGGDFDFNVVIRSIMYNAASHYLQYIVGSGITIYCDAEKEYEECLLKAAAIQKVLSD